MSDTANDKLIGIASYYKGTQEELLNIPVSLIDQDAIYVDSVSGEMWTGIQLVNILSNGGAPQDDPEEVPTVFGARRQESDSVSTGTVTR